MSSFPISISTFARRLSVFFYHHSSFFQLKSGSKTDLCLYDFVCLHIFFVFFYVSVSDVSKGGETQNKNSVCCHFKLDLESKLKNSTALSAHKLKTRPTTTHIRLISVRAFLGEGGAILVLHAVGVIESSSWPTVCVAAADKTIKISAKRRRFHYVLYRFVCLTVLFTYFVSLSLVSLSLLYKCHLLIKCFIISPFFRSITCAFVSFPSRLPHMAPFFKSSPFFV